MQSVLHARIKEGVISTTLVHWASIASRVSRSTTFDLVFWTCPGDKEATALFRRQYRAPFVVPELA